MLMSGLGAESNDFTHDLLQSIGPFYISYTIMDESSEALDGARQSLTVYARKLHFQQLDIQNESVDGLPTAAYDMVLIPRGIGHSRSLGEVLGRIRRLLKPGGYLILAESVATHPASTNSGSGSSFSAVEWNRSLKSVGFSGVDTMTDMPPSSTAKNVLVSHATDRRVDLLTTPLRIPSTELSIEDLVIIGGATLETAKLVDDLEFVLSRWSIRTNRINSMENIEGVNIPSGCAVISLTELDESLFKGYSASRHVGLATILSHCGSIVWVTRGGQNHNPYARMMAGFMRTMAHESPHIRSQMIEISPGEKANVNTFASSLLRLQFWGKLDRAGECTDLSYTIEPEILLVDDCTKVLRLRPTRQGTNRYNAGKRVVENQVNPAESVIHVCNEDGELYCHQPSSSIVAHAGAEEVGNLRVRVLHSTLSAVKIQPSSYLYLVLGEAISTGKQVLALSKTNSSIIDVPTSWTREVDVLQSKTGQTLHSAFIRLLVQPLLSTLPVGGTLLVHEPPAFISSTLQKVAQTLPLRIIFTTIASSSQVPSYITLHKHISDRGLKAALPKNVAMVLDFSAESNPSGTFGKRISQAFQPNCRFEDVSSLFRSDAFLSQSTQFLDNSLANAVQDASSAIGASCEVEGLQEVTLNNLPAPGRFSHMHVIDWTAHRTVNARVETIDMADMFKPDRTYLLVGLTGDIGRLLCEWMVSRGAKYVVLTSRNPRIEKEWLAQVQEAGATVKVLPLDVSNQASLNELYHNLSTTLPPIAGVANGAMVLRDAHFHDTPHDDFTAVLKPKVDGSINLDGLFSEDKPLDWFILFSSSVYWIGNRGQTAYGAANAFIAGLAAQRRHRGLPSAALHLGVVVGAGYASQSLPYFIQMALRRDFGSSISQRDVVRSFAEAVVTCQTTQLADVTTGVRCATEDLKKTIWYNNPIVQHLTRPGELGEGSKSGGGQDSVLGRLTAAPTSEAAFEVLQQAFTTKLGDLLQLDVASTQGSSGMLDKAIDDLGVDSLVAAEIRTWFNDEVTVDVPVLKILGGLTVKELLQEAFDKLPADVVTTQAVEPPKVAARETSKPKLVVIPVEHAPKLASHPTTAGRLQPDDKISVMDQTENTIEVSCETNSPDRSSGSSVSLSSGGSTPISTTEDESHDSELWSIPSSPSSVSPSSPKLDIEKSLEMSYGQARFWFLGKVLRDPATFNVTVALRFDGKLRANDLARAIDVVGQRHEALRTCFYDGEDGKPMQAVLHSSSLCLEQKTVSNSNEVFQEMNALKAHTYDIGTGENVRILLVHSSPTQDYLLIGYHHINMDGVSFQVLMADLEKAYQNQTLSPHVLQYTNYSERQRANVRNGHFQDELSYWRQVYSDLPEILPLFPFADTCMRLPQNEYDFVSARLPLERSFADRITSVGQKCNASNFHFYLATLKVLLSRFLGTSDVCIGIADANRVDKDTMGAIGMYLNVLPLRLRTQPGRSFLGVLRNTRTTVRHALANSKVPFDVLLDELNVPRSSSHSPLFQVFMDYRGSVGTAPFSNLQYSVSEMATNKTPYDLILDIAEAPEGVMVTFKLQKSLYSLDDAEILAKSYQSLLEAFSQDVGRLEDDAPLFSCMDVERAIELGKGKFNAI